MGEVTLNTYVPEGRCDRSLARSAWDSAIPKSRPVGYGLIRAGDAMGRPVEAARAPARAPDTAPREKSPCQNGINTFRRRTSTRCSCTFIGLLDFASWSGCFIPICDPSSNPILRRP